LILIGVVGLLLDDVWLLDILCTYAVEDILHTLTGGILAYGGFVPVDNG
jgi:hypothetical protein